MEVTDDGIRWAKLFGAALPLVGLALLSAFDVSICPAKNLLGVPCPGCGLTRATEAMVRGEFAAMLRFHPLAPLLAPTLIYAIGRTLYVSATGKHPRDLLARLPSSFWTVALVVLVGFWLARMTGAFGGLPDPLDPTRGWLYRGARFAYGLFV